MLNLATTPSAPNSATSRICPAVLVEDERPDGSVFVRLAQDGPGRLLTARVAVPRSQLLAAGHEVLLASGPDDQLYVVGVLSAPEPPAHVSPILATSSGAYATRVASAAGAHERLQVFSGRRELLFEYEPASGRTVVNIPAGDLALRAERGHIDLQAAGRVRIDGRTIELTGDRLDVTTKQTRWITERLETIVGTLVEKARNAYRTVEELAQLRSGRMRTIVDETYQFRSRNAYVKAEEDYKIRGDQIHLG